MGGNGNQCTYIPIEKLEKELEKDLDFMSWK